MSDATSGAVAAPSKKSSLMMFMIVILALAAGGSIAYIFAGKQGEKVAQDGEAAKSVRLPAQYVKLDPPFVVNFEAKGLMRFLQVTVEVMTRDPASVELIDKNEPMIRNDLIMLFGSQRYEDISTREGKERLRADALKVVSDVINAEGGDGSKIEQLYFTSFVMQ
jgi:flagellar FliL protein